MNSINDEIILSQNISERVENLQQEQLELLKNLTSIDCCTGDIKGNQSVVEILVKELEKLGANIELISVAGVGTHIVAKIIPENPKGKIILNAHIDTVFERGSVLKYPFRIDGKFAYGLGTADDKGGVVVALYGVKTAINMGFDIDKEIVFIFNCDEETGSNSSKEIFLREGQNADYAIVFEPVLEGSTIITKRKGMGRYIVKTRGVEAHSGIDFDKGRSAIVELADKIMKIHNLTGITPDVKVNVGILSGGSMVSIIPGNAQAEFCVRVNNTDDMKLFEKHINTIASDVVINGCTTEITGMFTYYPMEKTAGIMKIFENAKESAALLGIDIKEEHSTAGGDACHINQFGITAIDGFGPLQYDIHTVDERVSIESISEKTKLFAVMLATNRV